MAIANGTCVSFCNQPTAHFGLPWVRAWVNRGKCHVDEKRIQCLSNASQHVPIYLQLFPSNSNRKFKSSPFNTFFAHFGLPWVRHWDNHGSMDGKRSNASQHVPVYLHLFTSYSEILVKIATFSYPLAFNAPVGVFSLEFWEKVWSSEN